MKMRTQRTGGFSLLEIMIALSILVISIIGLVSVISYTTTSNEVNRENLLAMRAAEAKIEEMRQFKTDEIFVRYSAKSQADVTSLLAVYPTLINTVGAVYSTTSYPGPDFAPTLSNDPNHTYSRLRNLTATVTFFQNGVFLAEDINDTDIIARDLNVNNVQGDKDVTGDYRILPATITIAWDGIKGHRTLSYRYMFLKRG